MLVSTYLVHFVPNAKLFLLCMDVEDSDIDEGDTVSTVAGIHPAFWCCLCSLNEIVSYQWRLIRSAVVVAMTVVVSQLGLVLQVSPGKSRT